jgi:hypothetical protein
MKERTYEEIVEKAREVVKEDYFGWNLPDYLKYLPYDYAKEFLTEDAKREDWSAVVTAYSINAVIKEMKSYLEFAFEKAHNERGISANRSMDHYKNWFWLIGEDDMADHIWDDYDNYGLEKLKQIERWLKEIIEEE